MPRGRKMIENEAELIPEDEFGLLSPNELISLEENDPQKAKRYKLWHLQRKRRRAREYYRRNSSFVLAKLAKKRTEEKQLEEGQEIEHENKNDMSVFLRKFVISLDKASRKLLFRIIVDCEKEEEEHTQEIFFMDEIEQVLKKFKDNVVSPLSSPDENQT